MINERLLPQPEQTAQAANTFASENFNTVLYTGNGGTQRIGGYINKGAVIGAGKTGNSSTQSSISTSYYETNIGSISLWFNRNGSSSELEYLTNTVGGGTTLGHAILVNGSQLRVFINGTTINTTGLDVGDGNWHNVVLTWNLSASGTNVNLYVDNTSEATATVSVGSYTGNSTTSLRIGHYSSASTNNGFSGKVDQVRVFNKAVSSSEVTTLYGETHSSTTISTTDIFSDDSGVALYQLDGNANDTGTGTTSEHHFFISDAGSSASSARLNSVDADFTYTRPTGYSEWGGTFDPNNQSHQFAGSSSYVTLSEGNKKWAKSGSQYNAIWGQNSYNSGKYYFELEFLGAELYFGITKLSTATTLHDGNEVKNNSIAYGSWSTLSNKYSTTNTADGTALSTNDVLGFAVDFDNRELKYYINNTLADTVTLAEDIYNGTASNVTYQEATHFTPDLVWIKSRSNAASNFLFDVIRGTPNWLASDLTLGENPASGVTSFDSNGFTLGGNGAMNGSSQTYVAWCFNGGTDAAASNTDGSITSTVKANQDAGFSIVSYTGNNGSSATIGHGLNSAPELVIIKARNLAAGWPTLAAPNGTIVYTRRLNDTGATDSGLGSVFFNSTAPTDSVFSVGNSDEVNDGYNYIAYCFHSVDNYSKVGSYTSDGSDGDVFVETNFEPAFLMIKNSSAAFDWVIFDNKRDAANLRDSKLSPNTTGAEYSATSIGVDFTSDGFVVRGTDDAINHGSSTFIYLAIAADPDETTPTVENSFDVVTYTGTGSSQTINTDFKPDLIWFKSRTASRSNALVDSVRGRSSVHWSDLADAAATPGASNDLISFDSNGFTVGAVQHAGSINASGDDIVAWCWKAGDHDDNLPQINTEGTIDSVVSVNAEAGFSIVKWTADGTTEVGHGLSSAPEIVIKKRTDSTGDWIFYTTAIDGSLDFLKLNTTDSKSNSTSSTPTSTVFSIGSGDTGDYIGYCFHSVTGYQKIGSYTGTGASGNAITTGFRPRFVMVKRTSAAGSSWAMFDSQRGIGEPSNVLYANINDSEYTDGNNDINFTSTGFTLLDNNEHSNYNNNTYIYLAIK